MGPQPVPGSFAGAGAKFEAGEVIDASRMSAAALKEFYAKEIKDAKDSGIMMSLITKSGSFFRICRIASLPFLASIML